MAKRNKKNKVENVKVKVGLRWFQLTIVISICYIAFHIYHKPSIILLPVSNSFNKLPNETWDTYKDYFNEYSSKTISPFLIAAIVQHESAGNPLAQTYWKWNWDVNPFKWFAPASSSLGLMQMTSGTWEDAKKFCTLGGEVIREEGKKSCWNFLASRLFPASNIRLASIRYHYYLKKWKESLGVDNLSSKLSRRFISVMHLCGVEKAFKWADKPHLLKKRRCGGHSVREYLRSIARLERKFRNISQ